MTRFVTQRITRPTIRKLCFVMLHYVIVVTNNQFESLMLRLTVYDILKIISNFFIKNTFFK